MKSLINLLVGSGGILAVQATETIAPPDPTTVEAIGKLAIQIVIAVITIWQLLKKKK